MSEVENKTSNLLTNLKSLVKTYVIHDANGRIIAAYEAKDDAISGDPCVLTRYGYREGASLSTQVKYRREYNATWDPDNQGWDNSLASFPLPSPIIDPSTV
jgi:hypothetical protein